MAFYGYPYIEIPLGGEPDDDDYPEKEEEEAQEVDHPGCPVCGDPRRDHPCGSGHLDGEGDPPF